MVKPGDSVQAGQKIGELVDMTNVTGNIDSLSKLKSSLLQCPNYHMRLQ